MEFVINLNMTSNELFHTLNQTIIEDVYTFTGKKYKTEDIRKGFKYEKDVNMNKEHPKIAKVHVLDYKDGQRFKIQYSSPKKKSIVSYNIESETGQKICLNYKEEIFTRQKENETFIEIPCRKVDKIPFLKKLQFHSLENKIKKERGKKNEQIK